MASANVKIEMTMEDGRSVKALQRLVEDRIKYTRESAEQALAACAIQVLISTRAATAVAKAQKAEVECVSNLVPSFYTTGKVKTPCLRVRGSLARFYPTVEKVVWSTAQGLKTRTLHVYSFLDRRGDKETKYLIVAPSAAVAKRKASDIIKKRIARHKGLARCALGKLMNKTAETTNVSDAVNQKTAGVADKTTVVRRTRQGGDYSGSYSLTCEDNLDYAMLALKGGQAAFDAACQKAANKIASVIQHKVGNGFFGPKIETPFPEVRQR